MTRVSRPRLSDDEVALIKVALERWLRDGGLKKEDRAMARRLVTRLSQFGPGRPAY